MNQTKLVSAIESTVNVASGFGLSFLIWQYLGPLLGYSVTVADNFAITTIFTIVSVVRSYLWRRFFNAGLHETIKTFVTRLAR